MTWASSEPGAAGSTKSTFCVQFWPYRCGMLTRPSRLVPKTAAATTATTATMVPAIALRTGTAVRPCPGSRAIRAPRPPVTEPALPSARASRDTRCGPAGSATLGGPPATPAARQAVGSTSSSGASAVTARPAPKTVRLISTPGLGSASRAGPIGISGDAAMAMPVPSRPPPTVTAATWASDTVASAP